MIKCKKGGWPDVEHPSELYLHIHRDGEQIERIVILKDGVYVDLDIKLETEAEMLQLTSIIKTAWCWKTKQDMAGWRARD
ncbi:hypothetical protein LCGC14_2050010 [marine sediment metagenome]|uniref:Uncharacterized protein n=1 Tax=marine sediment metagenome TaxID=412755 RepID=A0A0F9FBR6_9ZZZZ